MMGSDEVKMIESDTGTEMCSSCADGEAATDNTIFDLAVLGGGSAGFAAAIRALPDA